MTNINDSTILQQMQPFCDQLLPVLKEHKKQLHVTNQDIADRTGISADTVRKFFAGESKSPNVFNVIAMCKMLDVSIEEVFGKTGAKQTVQIDDARIKELESDNHDLKLHLEFSQKAQEHLEAVNQFRLRIIYFLLGLCTLLTAFSFVFLAVDRGIPQHGFIREDYTSPFGIFVIITAVISVIVCIYVLYRIIKRRKK